MSQSPPTKKLKSSSNRNLSFNASSITNNDHDLALTPNSIPLLPRDSQTVILDIEGTTTSISFVKDVLFPYALDKLDSHVDSLSIQEKSELLEQLQQDIHKLDINHPAILDLNGNDQNIQSLVRSMMKQDVKGTGLKQLQGLIWKHGYDTNELKGHVYQDFLPFLQWCESQSVQVYIYSSGSVGAQKLLFGHSIVGNLLEYLNGHYDTKIGGKKEAASYKAIAQDLGKGVGELVFVSDSEDELVAAKEAGLNVVMSVRPGNVLLTGVSDGFGRVFSLLQICGSGK